MENIFEKSIYIALPFVAWVVAGSLKFAINYIRYGKMARSRIGYGGFPSTHTTILTSVVAFAGFTSGFTSPLFTLGLGCLIVLIIDAHGLRRKVGFANARINALEKQMGLERVPLREHMGHTWPEIVGGLVLGGLLGNFAYVICK